MKKKAFKVKLYKWWSLKAWRCAKLVEEFSRWLCEHPEEIVDALLKEARKQKR